MPYKNSEKQREYMREYMRRSRGCPVPTRPQPENCECCGAAPNQYGQLQLDHSHTAGEFRGWLCHNCNAGIGKLGDDEQGLLNALAYIRRNLELL